jgi:hypothetical protein
MSLQRTHLERRDLDWLPPRYRAIKWTVAGTIWTGMFGGIAALLVATHGHGGGIFGGLGKAFAGLIAGGYVAGDRAARRVLRGRLQKLAGGAVDPARLPAEPDGELVHVTGRVRSHGGTVAALVDGQPVVWRRVVFGFNRESRVVHEAAVDFWLEGETGEPIAVETAEARLLVPNGKDVGYEEGHAVASALVALLPAELQPRVPKSRKKRKWKVRAAEMVLRDGDLIEVLGYKARTVDPTMASRLERDTPYRASLRGGRVLPLLIAPRTS